jgi:hypothetical protein
MTTQGIAPKVATAWERTLSAAKAAAPLIPFPDQQRRDQEAGQHEEDINPDIATREDVHVEKPRQHRDRAQAIERWPMPGRCESPPAPRGAAAGSWPSSVSGRAPGSEGAAIPAAARAVGSMIRSLWDCR